MISKDLILFIVLLANLSLTSCRPMGNADFDGIIIKTTDEQLLLATELSFQEYEEIKDQPASEIQNADVLGDAYYGLINLTYEDTDSFSPGDYVQVWIDGDILESYPMQAKASRVALIKKAVK